MVSEQARRRRRGALRKAAPVTYETVRAIALTFPGVADSISYGTRSLKVQGKFLARLREDDESLALRVEFPVREALMQAAPTMFYITDHYLNYPAILVRLSTVSQKKLRQVLEHAWRALAPKRLVRAYDDRGARTVASRRRSQ